MYNFVKVKMIHAGLELDYSWCLKIDNLVDLLKHEQETDYRYADAFDDYVKSFITREKHSTNMASVAIEILSKSRGESPILSLSKLIEAATEGKIKALERFGIIYIQKSGSYFPKTDKTIEYSEVIESADYPEYTEKDISIKRWAGGKHFYAKIGDTDVVIDGEVKWNSYDTAMKMAKKYLKEEM